MMLTRKQQEKFMVEAPKRRVDRIKRWGGEIHEPRSLKELREDTKDARPPLTNAALDAEFDAWIWPGRNQHDLRFGQYLCINYEFVPDVVFSCENTASVYVALCEYLSDVQR